jgi:threonine dehydrogenase-like Zn-dependent dehydrogenase
VPFNIACGRCGNCKERKTGICLNVNPDRPGSAYGYVDMGRWVGGQAQYVLVPYADWNLLVFPDSDQALEKVRDLTMLSDIFPTGFHGPVTAWVKPGSTAYAAGAGPVGLATAHAAQLLGAAVYTWVHCTHDGSLARQLPRSGGSDPASSLCQLRADGDRGSTAGSVDSVERGCILSNDFRLVDWI